MTRGARILVVDDDVIVRDVMRRALALGGATCVDGGDATEALERLGVGDIDAVILDGLLPDMHGIEVAGRMLDDDQVAGTPVCFLTGAVPQSLVSSAGFACMAKPVRAQPLLAEVGALLRWRDAGGSPVDERRAALAALAEQFLIRR